MKKGPKIEAFNPILTTVNIMNMMPTWAVEVAATESCGGSPTDQSRAIGNFTIARLGAPLFARVLAIFISTGDGGGFCALWVLAPTDLRTSIFL
mmetsp:Transcript_10784/g.18309  ORF Transcript_10784/g.18309 Transcript_10784/m.18309 type:complete len:94 (-) Transcript_10784:169-450(-)